ncbi:hypothetical protein TNCV_4436301 [Trichonephila clavipes]|nr:hypothetical protein TNCV_4436301 [Trichonephila clavipes]
MLSGKARSKNAISKSTRGHQKDSDLDSYSWSETFLLKIGGVVQKSNGKTDWHYRSPLNFYHPKKSIEHLMETKLTELHLLYGLVVRKRLAEESQKVPPR